MSKITISGNLESLKESLINEIEGLYELEFDRDDLVPVQLAEKIAGYTARINREIAVYLNRKGNVVDISIGDSGTVSLPQVEGRRDRTRLSGLRCIHTHPNSEGMLSAVDISSLLKLRLDAMVAIGVKDGSVLDIYAALPLRDESGEFGKADIYGPFDIGDKRLDSLFALIYDRDKALRGAETVSENEPERAILVGLEGLTGKTPGGKSEGERSLDELEELARTAGITVVKKVLQKKAVKDPAFFIGKGKTEELSLLRQAMNVNVIIFDDELSGAQVRNIEDIVGVKVVDRTVLILDIFAQRAHSREGKLQVELAQLKYRLPRLIGLGNQLSRLGGGIGTRGPGEKKLEVDRRHINRRVNFLERELGEISRRRGYLRENRKQNTLATVALVGYTNAGKSTLMNKLCSSDVLAENKLFATLDPTVRKLEMPDGKEMLLIDTVGFIRKLPHELIDAFKSTLEEAVFADVLLHVVDASSEEAETQISVVNEILGSLNAMDKPAVLALNKIDLSDKDFRIPPQYAQGKVFEISAVTGEGLKELLEGLIELLPNEEVEIELLAPYSEGWIPSYIYENGKILSEEYIEPGISIKAVINKSKAERLQRFIIKKDAGIG